MNMNNQHLPILLHRPARPAAQPPPAPAAQPPPPPNRPPPHPTPPHPPVTTITGYWPGLAKRSIQVP